MAIRHGARPVRRAPADKRRSAKFADSLACRAFVHTLDGGPFTRRNIVRRTGISRETVRRWERGESPVSLVKIEESPQLLRHYIVCLGAIERRDRRKGRR